MILSEVLYYQSTSKIGAVIANGPFFFAFQGQELAQIGIVIPDSVTQSQLVAPTC